MPAQFSKELVATVLLEALYTTDELACSHYDISIRSLQRYRQALPDDPELTAIVATKQKAFNEAWAERVPMLLRKGMDTLCECMEAIRGDSEKKKDPQVIAAIAGAMKLAADIHLTGKVINARLADADRQANGLSSQAPADAPAYAN